MVQPGRGLSLAKVRYLREIRVRLIFRASANALAPCGPMELLWRLWRRKAQPNLQVCDFQRDYMEVRVEILERSTRSFPRRPQVTGKRKQD